MQIVQAAKIAFNKIDHGYCDYDDKMLDPIFKHIVTSCEQSCNTTTKQTLCKMIRIRKMNKKRIRNMAIRFLQNWKEHYYNPENENGFVFALNKKYSHKLTIN